MTTLKLSDELYLPLDIVTSRIATYGTSGAGKTAFGRLLAEKVHAAGHRFCAIDLKNDWWGLKSSADGLSHGIPVVVFGGPRKDVPLFADAGAVVADTICAIDQSCVIDLDELSKGKQLKFLTAFLERLYDVNRDPLLLIADEADRYAPQKAMSVEANISLGAAEDICRRGRKRGIGSMWLTQRTAVLNKNVSDICDLTVVFRTPGSRDLKELEDRVARIADRERVAQVMRLAPALADGQAIFLSSHPKLRDFLPKDAQPIQLPLPRTFDSSATPGVGKRRAEPKVLAKTDLAEIEKRMASQVERAKAEDPAALRRELADLKRELSKLPVKITACDVKIVEKPVLKDGQLARVEKICDRIGVLRADFMHKSEELISEMSGMLGVISAALTHVKNANMQIPLHNLHKPGLVAPVPRRTPAPAAATPKVLSGDFQISSTQQRILDALAWWESIGNPQPTAIQVGAIAVMDASGGHFSNVVGPLSSNGLVTRGNGVLSLTDQGRQCAQLPASVASLDDYHNMLRERVRRARSTGAKTVAILDAVISCGPGAEVTTQDIGNAVGMDHTGGHFSNTIGPLSTMGLIKRAAGKVRATELIFPPGLP